MKQAEILMRSSSNDWIRKIHRWVCIVFTVTVVANMAVRTQGEPAAWITYSPLLPLALLLLTGLYLFALPYANKGRERKTRQVIQPDGSASDRFES
jgi:hypothetical protein